MKLNEPVQIIVYRYQPETQEAASRVPEGTVSRKSHDKGMEGCEPLIVMMDSLIRYAKAHKARYYDSLASDGVLGPEWLNAAKAVKALLNGDGALAMERKWSADSKDNGAVESMFWQAMEIAGFTEADL